MRRLDGQEERSIDQSRARALEEEGSRGAARIIHYNHPTKGRSSITIVTTFQWDPCKMRCQISRGARRSPSLRRALPIYAAQSSDYDVQM